MTRQSHIPAMSQSSSDSLSTAIAEASACRLCANSLPLGPRPVFRVSATARMIIIGQAPSTKVHITGLPWNDASGERLRLSVPASCFPAYPINPGTGMKLASARLRIFLPPRSTIVAHTSMPMVAIP